MVSILGENVSIFVVSIFGEDVSIIVVSILGEVVSKLIFLIIEILSEWKNISEIIELIVVSGFEE